MSYKFIFNPLTGKFDIVPTETVSSGSSNLDSILVDQSGNVLVDLDFNLLTGE